MVEGNAEKANKYPRVYFVLLLCGQLYDEKSAAVLNKLAQVLNILLEAVRLVLVKWLTDMDAERLRKLV